MPRDTQFDPLTLLPEWVKREKSVAAMLPYVSLADDVTVRTRGNEIFQCIRLEGVNSYTTDDQFLDRTRALFASIIAQTGTEYGFYVHKVSKAVRHELDPISGDDFAAAVDARWRAFLESVNLRDKTLTLTVVKRPALGTKVPLQARKSAALLRSQTTRRSRLIRGDACLAGASHARQRRRTSTGRGGRRRGPRGRLTDCAVRLMGVLREHHGQGCGRTLRDDGVRWLTEGARSLAPEPRICRQAPLLRGCWLRAAEVFGHLVGPRHALPLDGQAAAP